MNMVTIPKSEYLKLKRYSSAYLRIASEISDAERDFPYDYKYIDKIVKEAGIAHKSSRTIRASSVDEALKRFHGK